MTNEEKMQEMIKAYQDAAKSNAQAPIQNSTMWHMPNQSTCPNCGYCPHCGRGYYARPYYWYGTSRHIPIDTVTYCGTQDNF